jgi:DNA-binding NarL/FixJ family response regulator
VRQSLEADHCTVVAAVPDAHKAILAVEEHRPDVCLLDIHMPGNGVAAAREIGRRFPDVAIVMLTASRDDQDLFEALRAGASGYLLKDMDPDRLAIALRGVLSGEAALPRALVARVMEEFRTRPARKAVLPTAKRLTSRESEVLDLMAVGLSTEDIANRLFVGQVTVRTHISSILKKLQVGDRDAAIRVARAEKD